MLPTQSLPALLLLLPAVPAFARTWSRPLWYQVGIDLQPLGCQSNGLEGYKGVLGCPGSWMGLGLSGHIYPVAGVTVTTMMLVISRAMLRRRAPATKGEHAQVTPVSCGPRKRRAPVSERSLLLGILHMMDSLLVHIENHLQHVATRSDMQIKGTPTQSG
ncbi:PREDICTED: transmembrane protein 89 [Elephantulus edwardii]|uniref:transmembrane protein 89 n=1 Tax=Elephantulus edwardii TaxID=28737 RepID=UPI0003F0F21A|nr:PREDICTED: transmembrane protein 89 [Elephantulus edwardii]